jgi:hypothetical protein
VTAPISTFYQDIARFVREQLPPKSPLVGVIVSASTARVSVSGIADQPVPCDWSPAFAAEVASAVAPLAGRKVLVHMVDGQPIVSHTIIIGEK